MSSRISPRWSALVLGLLAAACGKEPSRPSNDAPARLEAVSPLTRTAVVGTTIPNALVVRVSDREGRPVENVAVAYSVTAGNGTTNPRVALTDADGEATAAWTLGTVVGSNQVTVSVMGVDTLLRFEATGQAGPVNSVTLSPQNPRLLAGVDSTQLTALSLDVFGNPTTPAPTFTVRDSTLISVDANGVVRVLRRGAGTWVIASAAGKSDSVLVTVLAPGQSICTGVASPLELAVGQVVTDLNGQGFCVRGSGTGNEYAVIPFYASNISNASIQLRIRGEGITAPTLPSANIFARTRAIRPEPALTPDDAFELRLRESERLGTLRMRRGGNTAPSPLRSLAPAATQVPAIGEIVKYNVDSRNFCEKPDIRTGKVVAISDKAIIVADTANPTGGFTDAEYRSIGVTFDTLVEPVVRGAFGAPSDIDANGRTIIFFTRAVNELTPAGAAGTVLGFFYRRDLYPRNGDPAFPNCEGSNVGEILYLLVPDTAGVINGNVRKKADVLTAATGTIAHEYQHLINASRRKYVSRTEVFEERWLDEGLAHIAEDLAFWRASGLPPRSNVDASLFENPKAAAAYASFGRNNFERYRIYLPRTETQAPIGADQNDDDLQTRGALWSFLRFVGDHLPADQENAFWFKLANSTTAGVANITNALGAPPASLLRDWAVSLLVDDFAEGVQSRFQLPSWNMRSVLTGGGTSLAYPLSTRLLTDKVESQVLLVANGASFLRFSVADGQDALFTVTSGSQPLPSSVQFAVVRVK